MLANAQLQIQATGPLVVEDNVFKLEESYWLNRAEEDKPDKDILVSPTVCFLMTV